MSRAGRILAAWGEAATRARREIAQHRRDWRRLNPKDKP